jgi:twinkle protein
MATFADYGIYFASYRYNQDNFKMSCPRCGKSRPNKWDLSVNPNEGVWQCFNPDCAWTGNLGPDGQREQRKENRLRNPSRPTYVPKPTEELPEACFQFFEKRNIPRSVVLDSDVNFGLIPVMYKDGDKLIKTEREAIFFLYKEDEVLHNIKFREIENKAFRMVSNAKLCWYNINSIKGEETVYICEGEPDVLSMKAAGYKAVISVPNGAPPLTNREQSTMLSYLEDAQERFADVKKFVLCGDMDAPGEGLMKLLAKRLEPERCWRVSWPAGCKDANDVLMRFGTEEGCKKIREAVEEADPYPIAGLITIREIARDIETLFMNGIQPGLSTGWRSVDKWITVNRPRLWLITGIPSSFKTPFVNNLAVNLANNFDWRFGIFSPETRPVEQLPINLIQSYLQKSAREGEPNRMNDSELIQGIEWLDDHFTIILPEKNNSIENLLEVTRKLIYRSGINAIVIDPWTRINKSNKNGYNDVDWLAYALDLMSDFMGKYNINIFCVAHPTKLQKVTRSKYPVPQAYDIMGGSHWFNFADVILACHRDKQVRPGICQIHNQKTKYVQDGDLGMGLLRFNFSAGYFTDLDLKEEQDLRKIIRDDGTMIVRQNDILADMENAQAEPPRERDEGSYF